MEIITLYRLALINRIVDVNFVVIRIKISTLQGHHELHQELDYACCVYYIKLKWDWIFDII
jgi:hypothetical protein